MKHEYRKYVLSLKNLAAGRGAPISIPSHLVTTQNQILGEYVKEDNKFYNFCFAMGTCSSLVIEDVDVHDIQLASERTKNNTVSYGVRKLF